MNQPPPKKKISLFWKQLQVYRAGGSMGTLRVRQHKEIPSISIDHKIVRYSLPSSLI